VAVIIKVTVFWYVTPCGMEKGGYVFLEERTTSVLKADQDPALS
jgi:hypothetical protein